MGMILSGASPVTIFWREDITTTLKSTSRRQGGRREPTSKRSPSANLRADEQKDDDEPILRLQWSLNMAKAESLGEHTTKGAPGIDGVKISAFPKWAKRTWKQTRNAGDGSYESSPALRVEIPKESGGVRLLGIPIFPTRLPIPSRHRLGQAKGIGKRDSVP